MIWWVGPGAGQVAMGTGHIWIPGDELDQFPKLSFLCLPGGTTLWIPEMAPPHESLRREKQFFCLFFVFSWLRFVMLTGFFLNRLNKGWLTICGAPESHWICAVLEALCKMFKIQIQRTKHEFFPLPPSGCRGHMPTQRPCTGHPWAPSSEGQGRSIYSTGWKPAAGEALRNRDNLYKDDLQPPGKWNRISPTWSPVIT